ncbi:MAG: L,D-transpeptidase family protein, partial [Thermoanaerobaculia bacterium]|nr:L,D-transpeptidase family protein [Thermoanaerobaculia bacterium]
GAHLRLVVRKARYRLDLFEGEALLKVYPIALGPRPWGAKQRQGDARTPEGEYRLIPHHESPNFGTCFYVCYPGPRDAQRGYFAGWIDRRSWREILLAGSRRELPPWNTRLGGLILVHGTRERDLRGLTAKNWTNGCIAMENADLLELLGAFSTRDRPILRIQP